jgi:hypothetical protein
MVNFFTTVVGIFTRLINLLITLAPLLSFIIWLHIRDLYYSVRDPLHFCPPPNPNSNGTLYRSRTCSSPVVASGKSCLPAAQAIAASGRSSTLPSREATPGRPVPGTHSHPLHILTFDVYALHRLNALANHGT